nr:MAG TPA: hypothetical protein [Caudoviricetes sp.]
MRYYKLLKDLPTFKAGQLAYISKTGNLIAGTPENQKTTETGLIIMIYHETTLKKFPNILTEWFEEIEEPTDSIHWKPKHGAEYFWIDECGSILPGTFYRDSLYDQQRLTFGNAYRTEKEAEKARDRRLAKVRLQRTSTFEPDFENCEGGWVVGYDYDDNSLIAIPVDNADYGEIVRYATEEDALKSIKENRADWLKYLGIKEWNNA